MTNLNERVLAMTVNEACIALSVGRSSVYKLIQGGQLQAVKIGRNTRIPTSSVRALIALAPAN
ncbi:MAG: DNA-binding protein [Alphaproteobacteria bacterium]|nr:MAG: DNA-binding protein [Alphaproteobacteria bacterium]